MFFQNIIYEAKEGVAKVMINRPDALNALTPDVIAELTQAIKVAGNDDAIGVIVLTGASRAFCAGVDLKSLVEISSADVGADLNNGARAL